MTNLKKLYLMRHATSNWPEHIPTDIERPLTRNGEKEALEMALKLKTKTSHIDFMMVSAAIRTQNTAKILQEHLTIANTLVTKDIYETSHEHLLEVILSTPDTIDSLLIVAHNPSISMLTTLFLGTYADLPPAVLVEIDFDISSWADIKREAIVYDTIDTPTF